MIFSTKLCDDFSGNNQRFFICKSNSFFILNGFNCWLQTTVTNHRSKDCISRSNIHHIRYRLASCKNFYVIICQSIFYNLIFIFISNYNMTWIKFFTFAIPNALPGNDSAPTSRPGRTHFQQRQAPGANCQPSAATHIVVAAAAVDRRADRCTADYAQHGAQRLGIARRDDVA